MLREVSKGAMLFLPPLATERSDDRVLRWFIVQIGVRASSMLGTCHAFQIIGEFAALFTDSFAVCVCSSSVDGCGDIARELSETSALEAHCLRNLGRYKERVWGCGIGCYVRRESSSQA